MCSETVTIAYCDALRERVCPPATPERSRCRRIAHRVVLLQACPFSTLAERCQRAPGALHVGQFMRDLLPAIEPPRLPPSTTSPLEIDMSLGAIAQHGPCLRPHRLWPKPPPNRLNDFGSPPQGLRRRTPGMSVLSCVAPTVATRPRPCPPATGHGRQASLIALSVSC